VDEGFILIGDIDSLRERIDNLRNDKLKVIAKFQLVTACRLSEAVGKYAVQSKDLTLTEYKGHQLALWTLRTAKRNGVPRIIALPFTEIWVDSLVKYFQSRKKRLFAYGTSSVNHLLAIEFEGLEYYIEKYSLRKDETVEAHKRSLNSHALRHLRLSELVNIYGFDDIDLATFAGWKMKGYSLCFY